MAERKITALIVAADPFFNNHRQQIVILAARHLIATIYQWREFPAEVGCQLRSKHRRGLSHFRELCRAHPEGREPRRPPDHPANQVGASTEPKDRAGHRHHHRTSTARPRRRGDRIMPISSDWHERDQPGRSDDDPLPGEDWKS